VDGSAYGLGLQVQHRDAALLVGHSGSLPGFPGGLTISLADGCLGSRDGQLHLRTLVSSVAVDLVRIVARPSRDSRAMAPAARSRCRRTELVGQWYWGTHGFAPAADADGVGLSGAAGRQGTPFTFPGQR